jgi:hypothetical protein
MSTNVEGTGVTAVSVLRGEHQERRSRRKKKSRVIEKKKSFHDLRHAQMTDSSVPDSLDGPEDRSDKGGIGGQRSATGTPPDNHSVGDNSPTSDTKTPSLHKRNHSSRNLPTFIQSCVSQAFKGVLGSPKPLCEAQCPV